MLAVLIAITVLVGALAVPFTVTFQIARPRRADNELRIEWGFGPVQLRIPTSIVTQTKRTERAAAKTDGTPRTGARKIAGGFREPAFRRRLFRFARDAWRAVEKHDVRVVARLGVGDPADTGRLWAILGPASGWLTNLDGASVRIEPDFLAETFELESSGRVRVSPLRLLLLAAGLLLSPDLWRGVYQMRAGA